MGLNHIYKVIWSKTKNAWVVVSEIAKRDGKSSVKSIVTSLAGKSVAAVMVAMVMCGGVASADTVYGTGATTTGSGNPVAIGDNATANSYSTSIGAGAKAGSYGISIGTNAKGESNSVIIGYNRNTYATNGSEVVAVGSWNSSSPMGYRTVMVGYNAEANDSEGVAVGNSAHSSKDGSIALGTRAKAYNTNAISIGRSSGAMADGAVTIGAGSTAGGQDSLSILGLAGTGTTSSIAIMGKTDGRYSIAIGRDSESSSDGNIAIGYKNLNMGNNSITIGKNLSLYSSNNVVAIGNNIALNNGYDGAILLGDKSAGEYTTPTNTSYQGITLNASNYSGVNTSANPSLFTKGSIVSVGYRDHERQIKNVAAGEISASSTDAINGSQLYEAVRAVTAGASPDVYMHVNDGTSTQGAGNATTNLGKANEKGGATGNYAIAIGTNAAVKSIYSIGIGPNSNVGTSSNQ